MSEPYGTLKHVVPVGSDVPNIPKAFKDYDDSVVSTLSASKGKLLIAQNTGAAAFKALKGDATLEEDGTLTVADAAITSRKLKPTSGLLRQSEKITLTETYADAPGLELKITPDVASILRVTLTAVFGVPASIAAGARLLVDGVEQEDRAEIATGSSAGIAAIPTVQTFRIPLTAAAHTIKVQARQSGGGGGVSMYPRNIFAGGGGSNMDWMLHAS